MTKKNPHLLKRTSLFAMFCLSYLPLFFLLMVKVIVTNAEFLFFSDFNTAALLLFVEKFGFIIMLGVLSIYAIAGTSLTFRRIRDQAGNALPVRVKSIKPKNEEALSYLASYVIPLLIQGETGLFEYTTFVVLFIIYYKLYSTSSLILINPILNMKYGLYDIEYVKESVLDDVPRNALIISEHQWINEDDNLHMIKLSHKLYFAY